MGLSRGASSRLALPLIALSVLLTVAARAAENQNQPRDVHRLLSQMYAQPPWYHRWILSSPGLRRNVPELWLRAYRADSQAWLDADAASRKLAALGTNGWPAIPALVDGVGKRPRLAVRAISVLSQIGADQHPAWKELARPWRGDASVATNLGYLLFTKNEFAQPYDARHRRFALIGLASIGHAAQPQSQHLVGVLETDNDHPLWPLAAAALRESQVESSSFVPLLSAALRDPGKHPYVRASAAHALAEAVPAQETLSVLRESLRDEFAVIRLSAVRSLWKLQGNAEEVLPIIETLLAHKLRSVRLGALNLVSEMGSAAQSLTRAVEERLTDENEEVQRAAGKALEAIRRKRSL